MSDFFNSLNLIKKYITNPCLNIDKKIEKELNETKFPPRYLLEIYIHTNPGLAKLVNEYINKDYKIFYGLTVVDSINILREYNERNPLYEPIFLKSKKNKDFEENFKDLKDKFKRGLGKPELEIFMMASRKLDEYQQEEIFNTTKTKYKKMTKSSQEELKDIKTIKYSSYKEYIIKMFLNKEKNEETCSKCELQNNYSLYLESNMPYDDVNNVDLLILSDQPGDGVIMKTDALNILNQYIKHYDLDKINYVISNIVLCEQPDKIKKCHIDSCHDQVEKLINLCKPTVILALGSKVCDRLKVDGNGIVNKSGTKAEYNGYDVILSMHPNYLVRNQNNDAYQTFGTAFQEVRNVIYPPDEIEYINNGRKRPGDIIASDQIYSAKPLPKKFYKSDWILINITRDGFKTIDHTFRNIKTGEKVVRKVNTNEYEYYYLMKNIHDISKPFLRSSEVVCKKGPWKFSKDKDIIERFNKTILYEGNVQLETKAMSDYIYHSQEECEYLPSVFRYDIEHDMTNFHGIDLSAPYKITYISAVFNGEYYIWILDSDKLNIGEVSKYKTDSGKMVKLIINEFNGDESLMLQNFWYTLLVDKDPDIISAWNGDAFDFPYLINRSRRLLFSRNPNYPYSNVDEAMYVIDIFNVFNRTYRVSEDDWTQHEISGIIVSDLMKLFEEQHQNNLESTSLNFCAELTLNKSKKPFPSKDATRDEWIAYNLWDTELLDLIDNKVQATNFRFTLMKIAKNTWHYVGYALGIVEGLVLYYAKKLGVVLRTYRDPNVFTSKFLSTIVGGFTQVNMGGLFRLLVDYDAASMYPSIMKTFNIGPNTLRLTVSVDVALKLMNKTFDNSEKCLMYHRELETINGMQYQSEEILVSELYKMIKDRNYIITPSGAIYCSIEEEKSIFFDILSDLLEERSINKKAMYDENSELIISKYNKQLALKIGANAFFGVYLFQKFMFYNTTIGASITMTGRMFIKPIMCMIDKFYGDLDDSLEDIMKRMDPLKVQDLWLKKAIYADTDGCVITLQDIIPDTLPLKEQLDLVEKELDKINPYIEKVVNDLYPFFNKSETHRYMKFKEDWLADKGLFYEKKHKRYAIHVVRENNKPKDEMLFRGIQIRRSETPKFIKEKLTELIEIVLKEEKTDLTKLFNRLNAMEDEMHIMCKNNDIALAKSVKFSQSVHSYKKVPFQIKAMQFWNALHKREDFRPGDKGYFYNISSIDYELLKKKIDISDKEIEDIKRNYVTKAIAIPQNFESVPEYINIDSKLTVEKVFKIPYENILEPIIEETPESSMPLIDFL
jgi:uracil-DNA glycosylase family 4